MRTSLKRAAWMSLIAFFGISAAALAPPPAVPQPEFAGRGEDLATLAAAGVWYCPWAEADATRDSLFAIGVTESATALLSLPHPIPGEPADTQQVTFPGPGARVVTASDVALRGAAPAFVEVTKASLGVAAIVENDDILAGEACLAQLPKVWHLPGGSTMEGQRLVLRLFNPFPETARVDVVAVSEFGTEPLPEFAARVVSGRSWDDIELQDKLRLRESLSFTITTSEGIVIPALLLGDASDEATWTGTSLSTSWEFPVTAASAGNATITVANPGPSTAIVEVDVFTPEGPVPGPAPFSLVGGETLRMPLAGLAEGPLAVRVRADAPIAAVVVNDSADGLAGTVGLDEPAATWLLPGAGTTRGVVSVWVLNTGGENATVTVADLDGSGHVEKVALPGGALRRVTLVDADFAGLRVDSTRPVTVGWSVSDTESLMFVTGIPLAG